MVHFGSCCLLRPDVLWYPESKELQGNFKETGNPMEKRQNTWTATSKQRKSVWLVNKQKECLIS